MGYEWLDLAVMSVVYTEPTWSYFWRKDDVRAYCEKHSWPAGDPGESWMLGFHDPVCLLFPSDNPTL